MILERLNAIGKRLFDHDPPPGPSWFEVIEQSTRDEAYQVLEYPLKLSKKYGEIFYISAHKQFVVTGARAFEHILKNNHHNYKRDPSFYRGNLLPVFGDGLIVSEGDYWKRRRRIAQPFYQQSSIKQHTPTIIALTQEFLIQTHWKTHTPKKINIMTEMSLLTLKIALKLFLNLEFSKEALIKLETQLQYCNWYCIHSLFPSIRWKPTIGSFRFHRMLDQINTTLLDVIRARRKSPSNHEDLLTLLLNDNPDDHATPLTDQNILAEIKTHLFTGFETGACALSWMWYLLAQNPQYQGYLEEEVDRVLHGRPPTWDDIPNLPMTKAIFSESTRLYPPAWSVIRRNTEEDTILGVRIPKNSRLFLNIHSLHHNPDYWDEPEKFYPERFLTEGRGHHPFAFLPFGAGPHMCIASHLAPVEMVLLIASIAQQCRFILPKKLKLTLEPCISLRPREAIIMQPRIR